MCDREEYMRWLIVLAAAPLLWAAEPRIVGEGPLAGSSLAVMVPGGSLAHTAQMWVATGDNRSQVEGTLKKLDNALKEAGTSIKEAVKLNFVMTDDSVGKWVQEVLKTRYRKHKPAISLVTGRLASGGAVVAIDAVAVTKGTKPRNPRVAVLPAGRRVYISGQSDTGTIAQATRGTLDKLKAALTHMGLDLSHVVQVKSFLDPISSTADVRQQIDEYFGPNPPPQVFVEWTSKDRIEIEMIAADPSKPAGEPIEYLTPPGEKSSPVYSKVARISSPATIYVSSLYGKTDNNGPKEINDIFAKLKEAVVGFGGDLEHLAKATYYVSNDAVSRELNEIRPKYYDPKTPPAASKAGVKAVGVAGKTVSLDMIGVPAR